MLYLIALRNESTKVSRFKSNLYTIIGQPGSSNFKSNDLIWFSVKISAKFIIFESLPESSFTAIRDIEKKIKKIDETQNLINIMMRMSEATSEIE